jgi:activator of HSP90 ATPase
MTKRQSASRLESITVSTVLPATPERIYTAWLSGRQHSAMTGGKATVVARVGGKHTAWDGYITGRTLELEPDRRIVQAWRSADFPDDAEDSRLEVLLEPAAGGTKITLKHSHIPAGQGAGYKQGWVENYFNPMRAYFSRK